MSRLAKHPIKIPAGVDVKISGNKLTVKGKKGELSLTTVNEVKVELQDGKLSITPVGGSKFANEMWGTTAANFKNMLKGVAEGYTKKLLIEGVGYRAAPRGKDVVLNLGFSHEVVYKTPEGIEIKVPKPTELEISGIDKQKVGQVSAEIRALKKPEPYKGKGIKYETERVRRKEGKKK